MPSTPLRFQGIALASVAAGPVFLAGLALGAWSSAPAEPIAIDLNLDPTIMAGAILTMSFVVVIGAILAVVPNMIGATILTKLGDHHIGLRFPAVWALAGGGVPAAVGVAAGASFGGPGAPIFIALVFTGTICALICRWRLVWDQPLSSPDAAAICAR